MTKTFHPFTRSTMLSDHLATPANIRYCSSCIVSWGWGKNDTRISAESIRVDTCRNAYMRLVRRCRRRVAGWKRGGQALSTLHPTQSQGSVQQGIQGLSGGERPFSLRDHALCPDHVVLHHLWWTPECAVPKGCGRAGDEILPGHARALQGDYGRRLRDRRIEVGPRLPNWRCPSQTRDAPCSARS